MDPRQVEAWEKRRNKSPGPPKHHLPTGNPNAIKTSEIEEMRMPYHADDFSESRPADKAFAKAFRRSGSSVEERRNASYGLLSELWKEKTTDTPRSYEEGPYLPPVRCMRALVDGAVDEDLEVRLNVAKILQNLCRVDRWYVDEWLARLANILDPEKGEDLPTRIFAMQTLGWIGPYAGHYSSALRPYFYHEEEYVRLEAIESLKGFATMGPTGPSGEVGRHKKALVHLLREDPSAEVRHRADQVLSMKDWKQPHWMVVQKPAWRKRVERSIANHGRGTSKGRNNEGKKGRQYWEKVQTR